jgi:ribosome-binding protein aMBF1 (putative translation factor)
VARVIGSHQLSVRELAAMVAEYAGKAEKERARAEVAEAALETANEQVDHLLAVNEAYTSAERDAGSPIPDLRERRKGAGLSRRVLAEHAGCSQSLIQMIERGYHPDPDVVRNIERALSRREAGAA